MEQQRALNALEPYLALSKSATAPRAAADLITQATSSPQTYVFAELLQTPNIQALRQSQDYISHLRLLEIFAWGTYSDYTTTPNLPPLNPSQHQKLLLLSLLPLCTSPQTLTYTALQSALFPSPTSTDNTTTTTPRTADLALESLITTAIYSGLLSAHLDPLHRTVRVTSVAPLRDLPPNSIPALAVTLTAWEERCAETLAAVEGQVAGIRARAREERIRERRREMVFEETLAKEEQRLERQESAGGGGGGVRGGRGGFAGSDRGGGSGPMGKLLGLVGGKGGKRAAPTSLDGGGVGGPRDVMDLDDSRGGRGNLKGVKRQGRGGGGAGLSRG